MYCQCDGRNHRGNCLVGQLSGLADAIMADVQERRAERAATVMTQEQPDALAGHKTDSEGKHFKVIKPTPSPEPSR